MTKLELLNELKINNAGGRNSSEKGIKFKNPELYVEILKYNDQYFSNYNFSWRNKLYNYFYTIIEIPKCLNDNCCNNVNFYDNENIYYQYCSKNCSDYKNILKKRQNTTLKKLDDSTYKKSNKEHLKKICSEKFTLNNPMLDINVKNEINKTNIKKYGSIRYILSDEYYKKSRIKLSATTQKIFSKKLNIDLNNVEVLDRKTLKIYNYCEYHDSFIISKNNILNRINYNIKNICTECFPIDNHSSIKEIEIKNFIENELNIKTEKIKIKNKEIDIYIPSHNLGIEFDGLYWHSDKYKTKNYHLNKTNICDENGIQLLHIFEDEWLNKKEIIKSIIKSKLKIFDKIINLSDYKIIEINNNDTNNFLNQNHYDNIVCDINIGIIINDQILSIMGFSKSNNEFIIDRFTDKINHSVVNSKKLLLDFFISKYNSNIIKIINKRFSDENEWKNLGFKPILITKPNCWYVLNNTRIPMLDIKNLPKIYDSGNLLMKLM